jgi:hypothetical protein
LWVPIVNGFPLLFADSGTYLRIGTELYFPLDRPATYGLLIAPLHFLGGLWAVAIAQALFALWLIGRVLAVATGLKTPWLLAAAAIVLALFSSLPWFAGQLMPDMFASFVGLVLFLILFGGDRLMRWERTFLPLLLAGLVSLHLSHLILAAAVIVVATLVMWIGGDPRNAVRDGARGVGGLALALLVLSSMNLIGAGSFQPSSQTNAFLLARLLDGRVAQPVFRSMCRDERLMLCIMLPAVENGRVPLPGQSYLWDMSLPRGRLMREDPQRVKREEQAIVARSIATRPEAVVRLAVMGWLDQLVTARSADGLIAYGPDMMVSRQIHNHFPAELAASNRSLQQQGRLQRLAVLPDRQIALVFSLCSPLLIFHAWRRRDHRLVGLASVIVTMIIVNAAVCGILSGVFDRYQSRVLWLLPLLAIVAALRIWEWRSKRVADQAG